jgi:hypothetical protein
MMATVGSDFIGKEIQDALGLKDTTDIQIRCRLGHPVELVAKYYPDEENVREVFRIFKKYELVEKDSHLEPK